MPEEIAVIITIAIISGTFLGVVKAILGYLASKHQIAGSQESRKRTATPAGPSLTTSELHTMIRSAVEEATAPLAARVEDLEHQRLHAPHPPLLDLPDEELSHADGPASHRRRIS